MNKFFDCRLCSFFDIRVKLNLFNVNDLSLNNITTIKIHDINSNREDDFLIIVDFKCEVNSKLIRIYNYHDQDYNNSNIVYDSDNNNDFKATYNCDSDSDNDLSLFNNIVKNCNIDDECTTEFEETRSFLY